MSSSKEGKRTRGEIACAECRRLKARCDRQVPCSTCVKRGCKMLCPNGTMPPGKGSRFVGVAEEYLRRKAAKLEERMRSLEDALAIVQINTSTEPHPLLATEWTIEEADDEIRDDSNDASAIAEHSVIDALGSLHLEGDAQTGVTRFFGPSGGSESLLLTANQGGSGTAPLPIEMQEIDLPPEINIFDQGFPWTPAYLPTAPVREMIEWYLPPHPRAITLCDTFLKSLSWMFQIVSRQQMDSLISLIYSRGSSLGPPAHGPHDLALLLVVLALGALLDPDLPAYNVEAQLYYRLARAALCLQDVLYKRSVVTVKVLHLMSVYSGMSGIESSLENCYSFLNFAGQVALQIGFHKDPSRWGFEGREAYERRSYFWTLLSLSLWQSLVTGRPPVIMPAFVDCQIPSDLEEATYQFGETPVGFGNWSSRYTVKCLAPVVEAIQATKPPSYQIILELDRKIREFSVPAFTATDFEGDESPGMRSFAQSYYRELTLMFLHRSFFAQAMADFPSDPLRSSLSQSFIVAYRCASVLLTATDNQYVQQPLLCSRVWRIWSFAFSAAVIVGTVATRRLGIKLDPDPFEHLEKACSLFTKAAQTSSRAKKALPILLRLREKAIHARIAPLQQASYLPSSANSGPQDEPDELEMFGGRTMLVRTSPKPVSRSFKGKIPPSMQLPSFTSTGNNAQYPRAHHHTHFTNMSEIQDAGGYNVGDAALGLPPEFEGLYREIAGPQYSRTPSLYSPQQGQQSSLMLEDRWSSFMHNATLPPGHHSHVGPQPVG